MYITQPVPLQPAPDKYSKNVEATHLKVPKTRTHFEVDFKIPYRTTHVTFVRGDLNAAFFSVDDTFTKLPD